MRGSFVHSPSLRRLLLLDGLINLGLGALLVVFPDALVQALGVPPADTRFYPSVLGAVLLGIGIALLLERTRLPAWTSSASAVRSPSPSAQLPCSPPGWCGEIFRCPLAGRPFCGAWWSYSWG